MADPKWKNGDYYGSGKVGRRTAWPSPAVHITYLSEEGMHEKFGRRLQNREEDLRL